MRKSNVLSLTLILILLLVLLHQSPFLSAGDDLADLDELLSIDEELESETNTEALKPSEAEILKRAQRVVLGLNNENAKKVINENELVLVLGYTPWCPRSAELMPRFAEAAMRLKEMGSEVLMAKIDAERYVKAAGELGIRGYPTMILFVNGTGRSYTGGFTGDEIVIWARKKTGHPIMRLSSTTTAEDFVKGYEIYVVGLFEEYEGTEYEEFVKAATTDNDIQFVETKDLTIAKILFPNIGAEEHFLGLVKSEPERFEKFEDSFQEEKILQFVEYNKFALVTTLTELNSARVYSSPMKLQVFIFAEADDFKPQQLLIQNVARKYKSKIMFVYVDSSEDNLAKPFLTLFGLEPEEPIVTAFDNRIGSKYLLESDITPTNLEGFCSGLLQGTLAPYFKSEPIPDAGGLIEKVVGRTFDASVMNSPENVFLEVYTPWCMDCETTSKQIAKLAKHFEGQKNLKFGRIDFSLNEHPKLQIDNFPALLFYPVGDKSNPIKISKKLNLKELAAFIKENMRSEVNNGVSSKDRTKDEL
ncbi:uncharacterized protein A4U43_C08F10280 [Asparagus officinalis]|uniref:protein disulfide isomerase-like 1-5 n=1 Tax=Asparagus officinalis TaxID=4686 RepID=UPI00098E51ED|nr:protein disulfide isomerase-like 1-5 [Asparagus officinalis]ONK59762.1 uncharacterized protein A4U43_C08F10280 [Asparagus officinalis]